MAACIGINTVAVIAQDIDNIISPLQRNAACIIGSGIDAVMITVTQICNRIIASCF